MHNSVERIRDALQCIDPANRDCWVKMAFAIKSELGEAGFEVWDAWSQQANTYAPRAARDVWKSAGSGGHITIATLFYEAKVNGWQDTGTHQPPSPEALEQRRRMAAQRAAYESAQIACERSETARKAALIYEAATTPAANAYLS